MGFHLSWIAVAQGDRDAVLIEWITRSVRERSLRKNIKASRERRRRR